MSHIMFLNTKYTLPEHEIKFKWVCLKCIPGIPKKKILNFYLLRPWLLMTCIRPGGVGWVIQDIPLAIFSFWPKGSEYNLFHFASFAFYGESYGFNRNWQVGKNSFKSLRSLDDTLLRSAFDSRALLATILHEMDHGCIWVLCFHFKPLGSEPIALLI